jgi:hypothetical protein
MIPVGIHENVQWHKATKNDRGTLVLGAKIVDPKKSSIDDLNSTSSNSADSLPEQDFLIFGPQANLFNGDPDTADNNMNKIKATKDFLNYVLLNFTTSDKIKWDVLKGTGVTNENTSTELLKQSVLDQIYANIVDQFIAMFEPFTKNDKLLFRAVFIRQNKVKSFAGLRKRYLSDNPFMEPMTVPKEQSKIRFTKWEVENGYHTSEVVESDSVTSEQIDNARGLFGN